MGSRLGVDLGTTWTAAAVTTDTTEALPLGSRGNAMPSVVALDGDTLVAGDAAEARLDADPSCGAREVKRRLGDTAPFVIAGRPFGAEALMGAMLAHTLTKANERLGGAPDAVVLTHPANWGEYKLDLMREIGRLAGREDVDLVPEPAAAAVQYAQLGRVSPGDVVAVYDFGGGTFDVAVVRCDAEGAKVLGTPGGLERLGGVDLDQIVLAHVDATLDGQLRAVDTSDPATHTGIAQLRLAVTAAKESLSTSTDAVIPVALPGLSTEVRITRSEFESVLRPKLDDTLGALDRALVSAEVEAGALAGVLLVGGSSRIPLVTEVVTAHTGRPVLSDVDAKDVVCLGAAGPAVEAVAQDSTAEADGGGAAGGGDRAPTDVRSRAAQARAQRRSRAAALVGVAAGVAVAGGTVFAATAAYGAVTDGGDADPDSAPQPAPAAADDESMDELDATPPPDAGPDGGVAAFTASPVGRVASRVFATSAPDAQPAPFAPAAGATATAPGSILSNPDLERARAALRDRLDRWQPPDGSDPEAAADMKADLDQLLDNFHTYPGQDIDSAIATLKYEFEDRVHDFAQDQKLDALMDAAAADDAAANALADEIETARTALQDRVDQWQAPDGADPAAVATLKSDLAGMVDRFTAIPGQTSDDAIADLKARFNDRVRDFAQDEKLDAVVDQLAVPDDPLPDLGSVIDEVLAAADDAGVFAPTTREEREAELEEVRRDLADSAAQQAAQQQAARDLEDLREQAAQDATGQGGDDQDDVPERGLPDPDTVWQGDPGPGPDEINDDADSRVTTRAGALHDIFDDDMEPVIGVKTAPVPDARVPDAAVAPAAATANVRADVDDVVGDIDGPAGAGWDAPEHDIGTEPHGLGQIDVSELRDDSLPSIDDMSTESGMGDLRPQFEDHVDDADLALQTAATTDDDDDGYLLDPDASMPAQPDDDMADDPTSN